MKRGLAVFFVFCLVLFKTMAKDDFIDQWEDSLLFGDLKGDVRARVSGTLDLEGYHLESLAPGLIYTEREYLFSPRLSLFLDAQLGQFTYVFVQSRVDRGFDPGDEHKQMRLDEYAVRFSTRNEAALNVQVGKFATVVGNWVERHGSWSNPFVTAPLVYENLTGVWDRAAPNSVDMLLRWSHLRPSGLVDGEKEDKERRLPVIWGPSYGTGLAISGRVERFQYAVELKNAALASRPDSWNAAEEQWQHPTVSGRIGFRPNEAWNLGLSASSGSFLGSEATPSLAPGHGRSDYREIVLGQDLGFAWRHFQLWTEVYAARFQIPRVGNADVLSYYAEAKYKFAAQFFGAVRWNQQVYGTLLDGAGQRVAWGENSWRIDFAPAYRFTPHTQMKLQYSLQRSSGIASRWNNLLALQFTVRF